MSLSGTFRSSALFVRLNNAIYTHFMPTLFKRILFSSVLSLVLLTEVGWPQGETVPPSAPAEIVLTKLFPPAYPFVARQALLAGTVKLQLSIRKDGTLADVVALSGPSILKEAAVESAQKSQFDCRQCGRAIATYDLSYKFELPGQLSEAGDKCSKNPLHDDPEVTYSDGQVTVVPPKWCLPGTECPSPQRVRAAKCLYLWKCELHTVYCR